MTVFLGKGLATQFGRNLHEFWDDELTRPWEWGAGKPLLKWSQGAERGSHPLNEETLAWLPWFGPCQRAKPATQLCGLGLVPHLALGSGA